MPTPVNRRTVDLSAYPDLAVVYLGMRVNRITGVKTVFGFGPRISSSVAAQPDGLLCHENFIFSFFPMHVGMRQYWRDMASLLAWTRSEPHRLWWKTFLRDAGGTGFWHETYTIRGGEADHVEGSDEVDVDGFCEGFEAMRAVAAHDFFRGRDAGAVD